MLSGSGTIRYRLEGGEHTLRISGTPKSYLLLKSQDLRSGTIQVQLPHGIQAYSFTFG